MDMMTETTTPRTRALYNADCPVCNAEMCRYKAQAEKTGLPVAFDDLNAVDLAAWGVTEDEATRLMHVLHDGKLHVGFDAMVLLWEQMPRMRWLGRLCRVPGLFTVLDLGYEHIVARYIYARHKRRKARGLVKSGARPKG